VKIERQVRLAHGTRFSIRKDGTEVARAYLYLMGNDLHDEPFGLLEDVHVDESHRGEGVGTALVREIVSVAKKSGCYKLIATSRSSRPRVHDLYERLGFASHGIEFRMDL
jgi:GNAT superfamily N-acetyltransferase